jgi:hypothetical protein
MARALALDERLLEDVISLALIAMTGVTVIDVAGRYLFGAPLQGGYEISELMMGLTVFAALPLATRAEGHLAIGPADRPAAWPRASGASDGDLAGHGGGAGVHRLADGGAGADPDAGRGGDRVAATAAVAAGGGHGGAGLAVGSGFHRAGAAGALGLDRDAHAAKGSLE